MIYRFLIVLLLLPLSAAAQNRTGRRVEAPGAGTTYQQQNQAFINAAATINGILAMEGAVDPTEYLVGPGDKFGLTIGGTAPIQLLTLVSAEGELLLFDIGSIPAAGRPLADVLLEANEVLQAQYQNVPVAINLLQPRRFYVHLAGAVPEPGRYLMMPMARLDDAVQQAFSSNAFARPDPTEGGEVRIVGSATSEVPAIKRGYEPALRNVIVQHTDGSQESYDLFSYYLSGNLDHNPYLEDGDVVKLSSYDERYGLLITGDVASSGRMEFRTGDNLLDILRMVSDDANLSELSTVRLTRNHETPVDIDIQQLLAGTVASPALKAGDHLNIKNRDIAHAAVYGFVQFPGTFQIDNAKTTLKELIELAGGLKEEASISSAYIERRQSQTRKPSPDASELDFFERTYFRRSIAQNKVSINLESALAPDAEDFIMYSGDVVVFPRDEQTVQVVGNVLKPGYIPFKEGQTAAYYIKLAGGEAPLSKGSYVFEAGSGKVTGNLSKVLRPGDTIFVNRESLADTPELQALLINDKASERQARIARTQTIITGVTALVGVINTFLLIRDRLNN